MSVQTPQVACVWPLAHGTVTSRQPFHTLFLLYLLLGYSLHLSITNWMQNYHIVRRRGNSECQWCNLKGKRVKDIYHQQTKLLEGNVFISVCLSVRLSIGGDHYPWCIGPHLKPPVHQTWEPPHPPKQNIWCWLSKQVRSVQAEVPKCFLAIIFVCHFVLLQNWSIYMDFRFNNFNCCLGKSVFQLTFLRNWLHFFLR